jgi:FdhE protein
MRQGEIAPKGKWKGSPVAGVTAPLPVMLPDPANRFAATATRLATLAPGHPAEAWLRFIAQLAWSQHEAASALVPPALMRSSAIEQAVKDRTPLLEAHRRTLNPSWRHYLTRVMDFLRDHSLPGEARSVMDDLKDLKPAAIDELADAFLNGTVPPARIGHALYVAAALQVHFTTLAAQLDTDVPRLLPQRGLCPCCGSTPVAGVVTASGRTPGCRYLHCSLCGAAWNHVRAVCINCGEAGKLTLQSIEGEAGLVKAETCGHCGTYSKVLYEREDPRLDPAADDLASLRLDMLVAEAGWSRHAPNPLLLVGQG